MSDIHPDRRRMRREQSIVAVGCRTGRRRLPAVWLTELSTLGCRLVTSAGLLDAGQRVTIEPKGMDSVVGHVKWVSDLQAGIEFADPLNEALVERLLNDAVPRTVGAASLVDRFGRPVPDLPRSPRTARSGL